MIWDLCLTNIFAASELLWMFRKSLLAGGVLRCPSGFSSSSEKKLKELQRKCLWKNMCLWHIGGLCFTLSQRSFLFQRRRSSKSFKENAYERICAYEMCQFYRYSVQVVPERLWLYLHIIVILCGYTLFWCKMDPHKSLINNFTAYCKFIIINVSAD